MIYLAGVGLAAPFGGLPELEAIMANNTFPTRQEHYKVETTDLETFIAARRLRRADHFTRMTLLAAYRALGNAGYTGTPPQNMGIVLCSGYGPSQTTFDFLDSILEFGAGCASPLTFSHSVHNIPAAMLALALQNPCPSTTLCQLHQPFSAALNTARCWLKEGRVDTVLLGAVDESTPLLKDVSKQFSTAPMGEGAAFFVLQKEKTERSIRLKMGEKHSAKSANSKITDLTERLVGRIPVGAAFALAAANVQVAKTGAERYLEHGSLIVVEKVQ